MKLFNDLRAAVNASDVCDSASAELDYPTADDDSDTNDTTADAAETAESEGN